MSSQDTRAAGPNVPHILDGRAMAARITDWVTATTRSLAEEGIVPGIAVVIVGDDPASMVYVASKSRTALECGFKSVEYTLPKETSEAELLDVLASLNQDPAIHGILVQLPLPEHIDPLAVTQAIDPGKDVDGFHALNVGRLGMGDAEAAFVPCTPAGSIILIESILGEDLSGLNAVVIGRSNIVGKPMANLLLAANATVTIAHSRTKDLPSVCRNADILVAAVGRQQMVRKDWVKPGALVIDVGINRVPAPERGEGKTRLVGDVDFNGAAAVAGAITPVPGGVGPMTIGLLMANTLASAARAHDRPVPRFSART